MNAGQAADQAQNLANQASNRADSLTGIVANLDNYRPVTETAVHFGFDKFNLTPKAKQALDELGANLPNAKHYIVVVDGNTDSVGSADYNYRAQQAPRRLCDRVPGDQVPDPGAQGLHHRLGKG